MTLSRRKMLTLVGGGVILAAGGGVAWEVTRPLTTALVPCDRAGQYPDPRMRALSWAILAPNSHNLQPWKVALVGEDTAVLYPDLDRLLPMTDPFNRQITVSLGCFLELMRMAALEDGLAVEVDLFPEGSDPAGLDERPAGRVTLALPVDMVQLVVLPELASFTDAYPDVELVFDQGSGLADLMRREADIAVRVVRPTSGDELVATRPRRAIRCLPRPGSGGATRSPTRWTAPSPPTHWPGSRVSRGIPRWA